MVPLESTAALALVASCASVSTVRAKLVPVGRAISSCELAIEVLEPCFGDSIRAERDTIVTLRFSEGDARVRFWTTDLTAEYVRLNADYHT